MLKFVKKKASAATSPQQAVEISRPSNLIVSKHKLVRTDGDFILIMEDDKMIGYLDKKDLDLVSIPTVHPPPLPGSSISQPSSATSSPQSQSYLIPASGSRSADIDVPVLSSPVGVTPNKYKTLPTVLPSKQQSPLFQWQFTQNSVNIDPSYRSTSVEQLFSPPIPTSTSRNRSDSTFQQQGNHKYDTITFAPAVQIPGSSSAQCNVEIRLGDDRAPPPPPNRAPPAPMSFSPCQSVVVYPEKLDFTEVQTVSVEDPDLAEMTLEEMRKHAEDIESYIQGQVQVKWTQEREQTERWIKNIAGKVAKDETINTIRLEMSSRKRPSLSHVFDQFQSPCPSIAPSDPDPNNGYEKLYISRDGSIVRRSSNAESDNGDIEDIRF
uniref:MSP domain-containing protein n=1 Tax=Caenorhabditis tropicalis TaxID=1561998 RepID=A0A1I7U772_9PELO